MRLREPYTGTAVEASGQVADTLLARGFIKDEPAKKEEKPSKKPKKKE